MLRDLRFAARALLREPRLTLVIVATLALGIAVNVSVFSIVNAVLLRPLPYDAADRLVVVWGRVQGLGLDRGNVSPPNFVDWRATAGSFESLEAYTEAFVNVEAGDGPVERVYGLVVTPTFFDTLGVRPALGRSFRREDATVGQAGAAPPVVLGHGLWVRRFAADPAVVGRFIPLEGGRAEVVGVLPSDLPLPNRRFDVFRPLGFTPDQLRSGRGARWLTVLGRLKPRVSVEQAQAEMDVVTARLAEQYPGENHGRSATVRTLREEVTGDVRTALLLLQCAVGCVLLIAAANVAHLQLARLLARRRELAIRVALGATRGRLARQFLAESLLLSVTGALAGLLLAAWCTSLVVALSPADLPRIEHAGLDWNVLAFTFAVAGLLCVLFGLLPLVQASTLGAHALGDADKTPARRSHHRGHGVLVVAEVALALMLLAVAGLLTGSFLRLQGVDPGFSRNDAIAMDISLGRAASHHPPARFFEELVERVKALPHVRAAGVTKDLPLSGEGSRRSFSLVDGDAPLVGGRVEGLEPLPRRADRDAECRRVSAGYFEAMGITLRSGRGFMTTDTVDSPGVVIVNEAFARRFLSGQETLGLLSGQETLGRQLLIHDGPARPRQIVGVVGDVKHFGLGVAAVPEMYIPHQERPWPSMTLVVRVKDVDPGQIVPEVRRELAALDRGLPLANVRTIREYVARATAAQRFSVRLAGSFAVLALLLTALGVYGVMAYAVAQRSHEIAIRKALGADRRAILGLVLGDGLRLVLAGLLIGLAGALAAGRMMQGLLYDVGPADPVVLGCGAAILAGVGFWACYVPARRASRLDPAACGRL